MGNIFSVDSLFYKFSKVVYYLLVLNFLWVIFSIGIITIGASTTALFYVTGKIMSGEHIKSLVKTFWHSFKSNFKQATIIWLILAVSFLLIFINMRNLHVLGQLAKYIAPIQFVLLFEIFIMSIYIFPLLAGYHINIIDGFKASFFIANRHIITTILCFLVFPGIYYLLIWKWFFILFLMSIYSFWIMYFVKDKFFKYAKNNKE